MSESAVRPKVNRGTNSNRNRVKFQISVNFLFLFLHLHELEIRALFLLARGPITENRNKKDPKLTCLNFKNRR